jgi:hypothetical protein
MLLNWTVQLNKKKLLRMWSRSDLRTGEQHITYLKK